MELLNVAKNQKYFKIKVDQVSKQKSVALLCVVTVTFKIHGKTQNLVVRGISSLYDKYDCMCKRCTKRQKLSY